MSYKIGDKVIILKWSPNTEFPGYEKYINTVATIKEVGTAYVGANTFDNATWYMNFEDIRLATPVEVLLYGNRHK